MNNIIIGCILVLLSVVGFTCWWWDVLMLLKGLIPLALLGVGTVAIAAGYSTLPGKEVVRSGKRK